MIDALEAIRAEKELIAASHEEVNQDPSSGDKIGQHLKYSHITEVSETNLLETPMRGAVQLQLEDGGEVYFEESRAEKERRNTHILDVPLSPQDSIKNDGVATLVTEKPKVITGKRQTA